MRQAPSKDVSPKNGDDGPVDGNRIIQLVDPPYLLTYPASSRYIYKSKIKRYFTTVGGNLRHKRLRLLLTVVAATASLVLALGVALLLVFEAQRATTTPTLLLPLASVTIGIAVVLVVAFLCCALRAQIARVCTRCCVLPSCCAAKRMLARRRDATGDQMLDRDNAETVMRSIRGIPYLIQAIQYSMETTYYMQMLHENDVATTSVIHTAPKCCSMIDSDHEECTLEPKPSASTGETSTKREQWTPSGDSSWNNAQLRISFKDHSFAELNVFPYSEVTPLPGPELIVNAKRDSDTASRIWIFEVFFGL